MLVPRAKPSHSRLHNIMHLEQLINDDDVCVRCGHEKQQHGVRIRGDGVISRVECQECPANKIRGWESTERINYHKQTIDIEDRYLVEHTLLKACWTLAGSLEPPIELSAAKHWRVSTHMGVRRRLVEDLIVPEKEKHILARLQQDICCGCQYEMPIHVLEIDHVILNPRVDEIRLRIFSSFAQNATRLRATGIWNISDVG